MTHFTNPFGGARPIRRALTTVVLVLVAVGGATPNPAPADAAPAATVLRPVTKAGPHVAQWPLDPAPPVVRPFRPPSTPYGSGHRGVDLAGTPGAPVRAGRSGRVTFAAILAGRGVVVVQHADGLRTTYEPVTALVTAGVTVATGEQLGTLDAGHPGCPAPACLHWGLRRGDAYLDPLSLLGLAPVRLFPVRGAAADRSETGPAGASGTAP